MPEPSLKLELPPLPEFALHPLPPIEDAELARLVFTHSGHLQKPKNSMSLDWEKGDKIEDNEKLEHVGDAFLGAVVTGLLHDLYPNLKHGSATHFAGLFYSYFKTHTLPPLPTPPRSPRKRGSSVPTKRGGSDAFGMDEAPALPARSPTRGEAYDYIDAWLRPLFTPVAEWAIEALKSSKAAAVEASSTGSAGANGDEIDAKAVGAIALLNEHFIRSEGGLPEYVTSAVGSDWRVMVTVKFKDTSKPAMSKEAVRANKKKASAAAAYKLCEVLGLYLHTQPR